MHFQSYLELGGSANMLQNSLPQALAIGMFTWKGVLHRGIVMTCFDKDIDMKQFETQNPVSLKEGSRVAIDMV